jgi:hypothetical protein
MQYNPVPGTYDASTDGKFNSVDVTEQSLPSGYSYTVSSGETMTVFSPFTVDGSLTVDGKFVATGGNIDGEGSITGSGSITIL